MDLTARIQLDFAHRVRFTRDAFEPGNPSLAGSLPGDVGQPARVLAFLDTHVASALPDLPDRLRSYIAAHAGRVTLVDRVQPVLGGEACKNDRDAVYRVLEAIERNRVDRHSYVLAIGGGAVLDCVGFAAAIAHRGVRLVRMPTTTLAQADSGVGVKNGINAFGKKNFLGAFAVPWAVVNDERFLETLPDREWRNGFVEAVKVAVVKDAAFFDHVEHEAAAIAPPARRMGVAAPIVRRSAELHLRHIAAGGDPFELTAARPLDFGHWAAHKLEARSDYSLRHGEAVAIGIAIDSTYSYLAGMLDRVSLDRTIACLRALGFELWHEAMGDPDALLAGLEEFREHLGGELTVTMLAGIGHGIDVHAVDANLMRRAIAALAPLSPAPRMR